MDDRGIGGLSGSLLEIASDPGRVSELYQILGEFCHKHRNRLNNLKLGLYLARLEGGGNPDRWRDAEASYADLERRIDALQRLCRPLRVAAGRFDLASLLDDRRAVWSDWGLRLDWNPPRRPAKGLFDPSLLGEALDDWARARASRSSPSEEVRVSWGQSRGRFRVDWEERGDAAAIDPGDFSLPVLARVIALHGGAVRVSTEDGLLLSIEWPSGGRPPAKRRDGVAPRGLGVRP